MIQISDKNQQMALPIGIDPIRNTTIYMVYQIEINDENKELKTRPIGTVSYEIQPGLIGIQQGISANWTPVDVDYKGSQDVITNIISDVTAQFASTITKEDVNTEVYQISSIHSDWSARLVPIPRAYGAFTVTNARYITEFNMPGIIQTPVTNIVTDMKPNVPSSVVSTEAKVEEQVFRETATTMLIKVT